MNPGKQHVHKIKNDLSCKVGQKSLPDANTAQLITLVHFKEVA